uniref:Caveolin n=1 Tax=Crassostrea virginica TaxID=6565 RepID=A0A8B8BFP9_CRAVI|nr:caveolin-3-like [Crassostrea virginica]
MSQEKELDMVDRDPNGLNAHVKVAFEDILTEPDGAHSIDCVWLNSYWCFNCGKNICYSLMTTLCGLFIALFWGCGFACITFKQVWCITPCLRCCSIEMGCAQKCYGTCINCYMAPVYENIGLMFSRITIKKL